MQYPIYKRYSAVGDNPNFHQARIIATELANAYHKCEFDEIKIVFSEFKSAMSQSPRVKNLLPIEEPESGHDGVNGPVSNYIFEPDVETILSIVLPQYIDICVYAALQNAKASEHGARMTAMSSATDNASDMISKLTLSLNRARQAAITTEISEIVGGAAALN